MQYLVADLDSCCIIDSDFLLERPNSLPVFEVPDVLRSLLVQMLRQFHH
jgi:hypothetical protein